MFRKSHSNNSWVRLLKQIEISEFEFKEYRVKKIRYESYADAIFDGQQRDYPLRSKPPRSWKSYRNHQFI